MTETPKRRSRTKTFREKNAEKLGWPEEREPDALELEAARVDIQKAKANLKMRRVKTLAPAMDLSLLLPFGGGGTEGECALGEASGQAKAKHLMHYLDALYGWDAWSAAAARGEWF